MSELILSSTITEKAGRVRAALSGIGVLVELRPDTVALVDGGLRVQAMVDAVAVDLEIADALVIDSADMLEEAQSINGRISALCADSGAIEAERKALTAPFNDLVKAINQGYGPVREHMLGARDRLSAKILAYHREQRRLAAEAEELARAERARLAQAAAEVERAAQEAANKLVEQAHAESAAGNETAAQTLVTEASVTIDAGRQQARQTTLDMHAVSAPRFGSASTTKARGVRETWTAVVTDVDKLILHIAERIVAGDRSLVGLIEPNQSALTAKAKLEKTGFNVPGVRADSGEALSVRRAAA